MSYFLAKIHPNGAWGGSGATKRNYSFRALAQHTHRLRIKRFRLHAGIDLCSWRNDAQGHAPAHKTNISLNIEHEMPHYRVYRILHFAHFHLYMCQTFNENCVGGSLNIHMVPDFQDKTFHMTWCRIATMCYYGCALGLLG